MTACVMGMNWSIPASPALDMLFCLLCVQNYRGLPLLQLINPSQWHSALWEGLSFGTGWREVCFWPCQVLSGPINAHFTTAVENCFSMQQAEMMSTHARHPPRNFIPSIKHLKLVIRLNLCINHNTCVF